MRAFVEAHLGSRQVARVIYGAIIGLAIVVGLQRHPPPPGSVIATLLGTAVAVGLAELYSEGVGTETRTRHRIERAQLRAIAEVTGAASTSPIIPNRLPPPIVTMSTASGWRSRAAPKASGCTICCSAPLASRQITIITTAASVPDPPSAMSTEK